MKLKDNNAELADPDDGWNVVVAQTLNGLGCGKSDVPAFNLTTASAQPVHFGTICQGGTVCQTELVDRRLGDYFANEIDRQGHTYIAVATRTAEAAGGSVALPLVIRQVSGPRFSGGGGTGGTGGGAAPVLPTTGGGALALLGISLFALGAMLRRRHGTSGAPE